MEGTSCDYVFNNSELNRLKGKWFSPQYPSTYPKNSRCKFTFIAREDEYVRIVVEYLHLQKSDLICLNSPGTKSLWHKQPDEINRKIVSLKSNHQRLFHRFPRGTRRPDQKGLSDRSAVRRDQLLRVSIDQPHAERAVHQSQSNSEPRISSELLLRANQIVRRSVDR